MSMTDLFGSDVDDSEEEENVPEDKMSEGENIKEHSGGSEHSEQEDDNDDEEPEGEEEEEEEEDVGEEEKEKEEDSDERSNEDEDEEVEEQEADKMEGPEGHVDKDEEVIMCYIYTGSLSFCMLIYIIWADMYVSDMWGTNKTVDREANCTNVDCAMPNANEGPEAKYEACIEPQHDI